MICLFMTLLLWVGWCVGSGTDGTVAPDGEQRVGDLLGGGQPLAGGGRPPATGVAVCAEEVQQLASAGDRCDGLADPAEEHLDHLHELGHGGDAESEKVLRLRGPPPWAGGGGGGGGRPPPR